MSVNVIDKAGKTVGTVEVPAAFSTGPDVHLLHQALKRHLANRRAGTADTKRRDEVAGGGRKPWRQKGTGRARQGSIRSPQWRKGGVVFGPHPRSFAIGMNKKARRKALAQAIGVKIAGGELSVLDAGGLAPKKTKEFIALFWPPTASKDAKRSRSHVRLLLVINRASDEGGYQLELTGRNVPSATVIGHDELSVHSLLGHERVVLTKNAFDALAEVCGA